MFGMKGAPPPLTEEEEQFKVLEQAKKNVNIYAFQMKRALDSNLVMEGLKNASDMMTQLRTSLLSPKNYYDLYLFATSHLFHLHTYFLSQNLSRSKITDLYEVVQYTGNILPRIYLLIVVGTVMIKERQGGDRKKDSKLRKEILFDLLEMCSGIQDPLRGLFVRNFLSEMSKDSVVHSLPDEYFSVEDRITFTIQNFTELNKLWIRIQRSSQRKTIQRKEKELKLKEERDYNKQKEFYFRKQKEVKREKQRQQLQLLIGKTVSLLSQIEGVQLGVYCNYILPQLIEQIINCKDSMAQQYLMECLIQIFPDEFHLATLNIVLNCSLELDGDVSIHSIVQSLCDRLSHFVKLSPLSEENYHYQLTNSLTSSTAPSTMTPSNSSNFTSSIQPSSSFINSDNNKTLITSISSPRMSILSSISPNTPPTVDLSSTSASLSSTFKVFSYYFKEIVKQRPDLSLEDILSLQLSLMNLYFNCYSLVEETLDEILQESCAIIFTKLFSSPPTSPRNVLPNDELSSPLSSPNNQTENDNTSPFSERPSSQILKFSLSLSTQTEIDRNSQAIIRKLLILPLENYSDVLLSTELKNFQKLLNFLDYNNRKVVSLEIIRNVLEKHLIISDLKKIEKIFKILEPLLRDEEQIFLEMNQTTTVNGDNNDNENGNENGSNDTPNHVQHLNHDALHHQHLDGTEEQHEENNNTTNEDQLNNSHVMNSSSIVTGRSAIVKTPKPLRKDSSLSAYEKEVLNEELFLISSFIHLLKSDDHEIQFSIFSLIRKQIESSGKIRQEKLWTPLIFEVLHLSQKIKENFEKENIEEEVYKKIVTKLFKFIYESVALISKVTTNTELVLNLYIQSSQLASFCKLEKISYHFISSTFDLYENDVTDRSSQLKFVTYLCYVLRSMKSHLSEENYETLSTKVVQYSTKLHRKSDQCRAICACTHMFWSNKEEERNGKRVLECLQKSVKVADDSMEENVQLFLEILNLYLYFIQSGNDSIVGKYISGLFGLIENNLHQSEHDDMSVINYFKKTREKILQMKKESPEKYTDIRV